NLLPGELYIAKNLMGMKGNAGLNNPYWSTWVRETWANAHTYKLVKRYMKRPAEQLYHTAADRYEMKNPAGLSEQAGRLARLRGELDRWMKAKSDPGAPVATGEALHAAR
ncbi:MAG: heparan N-sulfatase, partial [Planctomycetes bacterium]|nr:heparan N-sulfatase [Planctomycetota bacterium]